MAPQRTRLASSLAGRSSQRFRCGGSALYAAILLASGCALYALVALGHPLYWRSALACVPLTGGSAAAQQTLLAQAREFLSMPHGSGRCSAPLHLQIRSMHAPKSHVPSWHDTISAARRARRRGGSKRGDERPHVTWSPVLGKKNACREGQP